MTYGHVENENIMVSDSEEMAPQGERYTKHIRSTENLGDKNLGQC
jgi:hypothetical protein